MATSFKKKTSRGKVIQVPGAKPSLYNNQLLVSTGIPSLDHILGGGLAVGTVMLIEEDKYGSYSRMMLKYFCAEAVMTGHSLLLAGADYDLDCMLGELPGPIVDDPVDQSEVTGSSDDKMEIAWRYRHLPRFQSSPTAIKFGHYYDLTKTMPADLVETINVSKVNGNQIGVGCNDCPENRARYAELLETIEQKVKEGKFGTTDTPDKRNVLRIAVHSLGSPLWGENGGLTSEDKYDPALARFLLGLRAILRFSFAVCIVTIPTHLFYDKGFEKRLENCCDTVVHVDSFVGSDREKNPAYKEYHGLFIIKKLPTLNSIVSHMPESFDLAFKLRRKKLTIEKLHLPPELSETANRSQEDPLVGLMKDLSCGAAGNKSKLDF